MRRRPIYWGTPCYRLQVHAQHTQAVAALAVELYRRELPLELHYEHDSVLPALRARQLAAALASDARLAVFCDADCFPMDVPALAHYLDDWQDGDVMPLEFALVGAITPCRDGRANVWRHRGQRIERRPAGVEEVYAVGFGLVVADLDWMRRAEVNPGALFWTGADATCSTAAAPVYVSEDVAACRTLADVYGGRIGAFDCTMAHAGGF